MEEPPAVRGLSARQSRRVSYIQHHRLVHNHAAQILLFAQVMIRGQIRFVSVAVFEFGSRRLDGHRRYVLKRCLHGTSFL